MLDSYTRATSMLSGIVWPVLTVAAVASLPTIRIFFGNQWDAAAPVATFMALWLILRTTHSFSHSLLVVVNREKLLLFKEFVVLSSAIALVIASFPLGLNAVAASFVLLGLIELTVVSCVLKYALGFKFIAFFGKLLPSVALSIVCGLVTWGISFLVPFDSEQAWKPVGAIAICLPLVWLGGLIILRHPLYSEIGYLVRRLIPRSV